MMVPKTFLVLAVLASSVLYGHAGCHNNCHGHGSCLAYDICSCHRAFAHPDAEDCSERQCPFGRTRGHTSTSTVHAYKECSDNGKCNRKSGQCECSEGYTGHACQRTKCPNDCSGNGDCQLLKTHQSAYTTTWDADQTMVCKCDAGFQGPDCSERKCPIGDDPLTLQNGVGVGNQVDEVQTCTISDSGSAAISGTFTISFTDWTGQVHTSRPLTVTTVTSLEVKEALKAFPNNVIPDATVVVTNNAGAGSVVIVVTFSHADNAGTQTLLTIDGTAKTAHGHQPVLTGLSSANTLTVPCVRTTTGTEESKTCSGRGVCNTETGICQCHTGFFSQSCNQQTSLQ